MGALLMADLTFTPPETDLGRMNAAAVPANGDDGRPDTFVQWKGTDLCVDFECPCGESSHWDGYMLYAVKCPACGRRWRVGTHLLLAEVPAGDPDPPSMQELDLDRDESPDQAVVVHADPLAMEITEDGFVRFTPTVSGPTTSGNRPERP